MSVPCTQQAFNPPRRPTQKARRSASLTWCFLSRSYLTSRPFFCQGSMASSSELDSLVVGIFSIGAFKRYFMTISQASWAWKVGCRLLPLVLPPAQVTWVVPSLRLTLSVSCCLAMYTSVAWSLQDIHNLATSLPAAWVLLLGLSTLACGCHMHPLLGGFWCCDPYIFMASSSSCSRHSQV